MSIQQITALTAVLLPEDLMRRDRVHAPVTDKRNVKYLIDLTMERNTVNTLLVNSKEMLRQQISNVLGTLLGQEQFEPLFGSNLPMRVFNPTLGSQRSSDMTYLLEGDVFSALNANMNDKIVVNFNESRVTESDEAFVVNLIYYSLVYQFTDVHEFLILKP